MKGLGRILFPLLVLVLLVYFLAQVQHILLPFLLSATIAYLVDPLVRQLTRRGIKRTAAVTVVYLGMGLILLLCATIGFKTIIKHSSQVSEALPANISKVEDVVNEGLRWLKHWSPAASVGVVDWLNGDHEFVLFDFARAFENPLAHLLPLMEALLLIPFLLYFAMLDGPAWRDQILKLSPANHVEIPLNILMEIDYSLGGYIRGLLLQSVFMGSAAAIGFWLMGLHYAGKIGLWVALTSMIPFVGPTSAAIGGSLVALFQWGTLGGMLKVVFVYIAIRLSDDWFFHPFVMSKAVHLHPVIIIFSIMAGATLRGFWGIIFAIPVVCVLKVLLEVSWRYYRSAYGVSSSYTPFDTQVPVV